MSGVPHWIMPVAAAIDKINKAKDNLSKDFFYGIEVLRKSLLANNSFDIDNLSEGDKRAARRVISKLSNEDERLPEYLFDGLREKDGEWFKKIVNLSL